MYTAFYGLREKPFTLNPDPHYLFLAEAHREALAHLLYGIDQGEGFIAVTGEVGTGKTTLCRTLLQRLGSSCEVAFVFNPMISAVELVQAVNSELGLPTAGRSLRDLHEQLNRFLIEKKRDRRRVLLIIDEAQNLSTETLEQVRLLSNLETETSKLLQIVLIGQPELDTKLASEELRQLRQRISVHWRLAPLSAPETRDYVRHRLRVAAEANRDLFTDGAMREIYRRTRGIPRVINVLCDRTLLAGYAARANELSARLVAEADRELRGPGAEGRGPQTRRWLRGVAAAALVAIGLAVGFLWQRRGLPEGLRGWLARAEAPAAPAPTIAPVAAEPPVATPEPVDVAAPAPDFVDALQALTQGPEANRFEDWLDAVSAETTMAQAMGALTSAWGETAGSERVLTFTSATAPILAVLNHPAVLRVTAPDGTTRVVLLRGLAEGEATLASASPDAREIRVPTEELEARWPGEAHVVWHDFESLPEILTLGDSGPAVAWLQQSLATLGLYRGPASGRFDRATLAAVRRFQRDHQLTDDGAIGPLTKMVLYDQLSQYRVPRLTTGLARSGELG